MMLTDEQIEEIKSRAEKATPGPWTVRPSEDRDDVVCDCVITRWEEHFGYQIAGEIDENSDDSIFIAHSRSDIPLLLAEVERLRGALKYVANIPGNQTPESLMEVNGINDGRDRGIRLCGAVQVAREATKPL